MTGRARLLLLWFACFSVIVPFAGPLLVADDGPRKADAIIVIGGDHKPQRMQRAVELYRQGYAPVVIISAGIQVAEGSERVAEAEVMRRQALALGMADVDLIIEDQPLSTYQNAYYARMLSLERGYHSVLLVASAYQARRARRIFRDVFGADIVVWVQPAPPDGCAACWWFQPDQIGVVMYEYYNWGRYWLGIRFPSEKQPDTARPSLRLRPISDLRPPTSHFSFRPSPFSPRMYR